MTDKPTRRDLMRPMHLLGLAFIAALFAGVVTLVSMGFFERLPADDIQRAVMTALVVAGITFIVVLVVIALLVLAVDPAQVVQTHDHPVLIPEAQDAAPAAPRVTPEASADAAPEEPASGD